MLSTREIPDLPDLIPSQNKFNSFAIGETTPIPVMTISLPFIVTPQFFLIFKKFKNIKSYNGYSKPFSFK